MAKDSRLQCGRYKGCLQQSQNSHQKLQLEVSCLSSKISALDSELETFCDYTIVCHDIYLEQTNMDLGNVPTRQILHSENKLNKETV